MKKVLMTSLTIYSSQL